MAGKPITAEQVGQNRPLSPHLQIWGWTVTMASSITHRATGIALYAGTILLALWAFFVTHGEEGFAPFGDLLASPLGVLVLTGYVWALIQHALGGVKHLYWDAGKGLDYETAKKTAWGIYAASGLATVIIVGIGLAIRGAA